MKIKRLIIVPEDSFVSVNGEGYKGIDLSDMDKTIHAVQWHGESGEIERKDAAGRLTSNDPITSIDEFNSVIDKWNLKKKEFTR